VIGGLLTLVGVAAAVAVYARMTGGWRSLVTEVRSLESRPVEDAVPEAVQAR
jgi:hypothetical protein